MDVRCEKCGTEYEFDEARISDEGVTVRCTECGYVFKVRRRMVAVTEPVIPDPPMTGAAPDRPWTIRRPNGDSYTFRELTTLQKWIVERKVSRDDEISRSGESWKRLGNIAELATFFQVVEQAERAAAAGPQAGEPGGEPVALRPKTSPPSPPRAEPPPPPPAAPEPPTQRAAAAPSAPPRAETISPAAEARFTPAADVDLGALDDDDFGEFERGGAGKWILLLLVLLAGGGAAAWYLAPDVVRPLVGLAPPLPAAARAQAEAGEKALAPDTKPAFEKAEAELKQAIAAAKGAPFAAAHADLADAYVRWGLALADQAESADGEKGALAAEASRKIQAAFAEAKAAGDADPTSLAAGRAMAEYYMAESSKDDLDRVLGEVDARPGAEGDAVLAWVRAMVLLEDPAKAGEAASALKALTDREPGFVRARYDLARALLASGDREGALGAAREVLTESPEHARAKAMVAKLDAQAQKEKEAEAVQAAEAEKKAAEEKAAQEAGEKKAAAAPAPLSYDQLLEKAYRLRDAGRVKEALDLYGRASDLKPGRAEPRAGKGWCFIEMRAWAAATGAFEAALQRNPRYGEAIMGLAESYRYQGQKAKAKQFYQRYLDELPDGPDAAVARNALKKL